MIDITTLKILKFT